MEYVGLFSITTLVFELCVYFETLCGRFLVVVQNIFLDSGDPNDWCLYGHTTFVTNFTELEILNFQTAKGFINRVENFLKIMKKYNSNTTDDVCGSLISAMGAGSGGPLI